VIFFKVGTCIILFVFFFQLVLCLELHFFKTFLKHVRFTRASFFFNQKNVLDRGIVWAHKLVCIYIISSFVPASSSICGVDEWPLFRLYMWLFNIVV